MVRTIWERGTVSIYVDHQHLSRLTEREALEVVAQIFVFGGKDIREKLTRWVNGGKLEDVAEAIGGTNAEVPHA